MSTFIYTPTNIMDYDWIFRDPITGKLTIPILEFNTIIPFRSEIDPLNSDLKYQEDTINHFYIRLKERWLYENLKYRDLLKYFKISKDGSNGKVELVTDLNNLSNQKLSDDDTRHIFKLIEKFFITRRFVEKSLRRYIQKTGMKWYDLYANSDVLKKMFRHKLKKIIVKTIYNLSKK